MHTLVPFRSKGDNRATAVERLVMIYQEREKSGTNLDSEGEGGHVETIKHLIVAPNQTGKSVLDGISEGDATATL
jgi:hypothetical protein